MHGLDWALVCGLYRCNNYKKELRAKTNEFVIKAFSKMLFARIFEGFR